MSDTVNKVHTYVLFRGSYHSTDANQLKKMIVLKTKVTENSSTNTK